MYGFHHALIVSLSDYFVELCSANYYLFMECDTVACELADWAAKNGYGHCSPGKPDGHHILSRSLLSKNKEAKRLVENTYSDIMFADVCAAHNSGFGGTKKCADLPKARAYLLRKRCDEHGEEVIRAILNDIAGTYTSDFDKHAFSLDALLARE